MAEGAGVEPAGASRLRQFSGLLGVPVPNLPCLARAPGFEPGSAGLESASLTLSLRPLWMHQEGLEPPRSLSSHSFTGCCRAVSASDARSEKRSGFKTLRREKTLKAGGRARAILRRRGAPAFNSSRYFGCQTTKEKSGPFGFPTGSRPAPNKSLRTFRDLGAGGPPPLYQCCNWRRSLR